METTPLQPQQLKPVLTAQPSITLDPDTIEGETCQLQEGDDSITTYTFNTHHAKHTFCRICGVQSFYTPRSNPDGRGIAPHCLDPGTVTSIKVITFDGQNWEQSMSGDSSITLRSK
ncbi:hypothetical protein EMCRGX_G027915 [Ephydatia muelleri]